MSVFECSTGSCLSAQVLIFPQPSPRGTWMLTGTVGGGGVVELGWLLIAHDYSGEGRP